MWGNKKLETQSTDVMRPGDATADSMTGWLGSSLHVKGDITGTEDLLIDGSVEGLVDLDERKLTVPKNISPSAGTWVPDTRAIGS